MVKEKGHPINATILTNCFLQRKIKVQNLNTGEIFLDEADIVLGARGGLSKHSWPDVEGLWDFKGKIVHSAEWDEK